MARNPKDLVVSYYQFHRSLRTMSYRGTFQEFCRRFMNDKCKCHRVRVPCPITTSQCWAFLGSPACNGTSPATVQMGLELSPNGGGAEAGEPWILEAVQILGLLSPAPHQPAGFPVTHLSFLPFSEVRMTTVNSEAQSSLL